MLVLIVAGDRSTADAQVEFTSVVEKLQRVDWAQNVPQIHIVPDADTGRWLLGTIVQTIDVASAATAGGAQGTVVHSAGQSATSWPWIDRRRRTTDRRECGLRDADADRRTRWRADRQAHPGIDGFAQDEHAPANPTLCTGRERQIVQLLRKGLTNKQIANHLGIADETVKKHLQHIYNKLGVRRRTLVMLG